MHKINHGTCHVMLHTIGYPWHTPWGTYTMGYSMGVNRGGPWDTSWDNLTRGKCIWNAQWDTPYNTPWIPNGLYHGACQGMKPWGHLFNGACHEIPHGIRHGLHYEYGTCHMESHTGHFGPWGISREEHHGTNNYVHNEIRYTVWFSVGRAMDLNTPTSYFVGCSLMPGIYHAKFPPSRHIPCGTTWEIAA